MSGGWLVCLATLVLVGGCEKGTTTAAASSEFKWGYRVCYKDKAECVPYSALFRSEDACREFLVSNGLRCLGGEHLSAAEMGAPVCWKSESLVSRAECNVISE